MGRKTVLTALLIFLFTVLVAGLYFWFQQPGVPQQVKAFNSVLDNKMVASENKNNWHSREGNIGYAIYNVTGENTGYIRMVIGIDSKNATDLSKVSKIVADYFPDKNNEIMSEISSRQEKLNHHWLVGEVYRYIDQQNNEITVKALDDKVPSIEVEIIWGCGN